MARRPLLLLAVGVCAPSTGGDVLALKPNLGSRETMVGIVGAPLDEGADIRLRPFHHGDTEQGKLEEEERGVSIMLPLLVLAEPLAFSMRELVTTTI